MRGLAASTLLLGLSAAAVIDTRSPPKGGPKPNGPKKNFNVQVGVRPYYLVDDMDEGPLKKKLESCSEGPFKQTDFVIAHRGASLQFPEHTREAYMAAARQGAGVIECDVAFTQDKQLVCRHAQCDLHTTTDILSRPELASKCTRPFTPAAGSEPADAFCCTSDLSLAEFKTLCAKMDGFNPNGTTVEEYQDGTPYFRTDLYATCGSVLSHRESIALIDGLGLQFSPELKTPEVEMPFEGYTQEQYAQDLIDEYKVAGIAPARVWPQSFLPDDIFYWIRAEPRFARQAVYLDERVDTPAGYDTAVASLRDLKRRGVRIMAPAFFALTKVREGKIVPSEYAVEAKKVGLDIITWSFERTGWLNEGGDYYYQYVKDVVNNDGDAYTVLDVLARQVGILKLFSDWPATAVYYANCFGLKG